MNWKRWSMRRWLFIAVVCIAAWWIFGLHAGETQSNYKKATPMDEKTRIDGQRKLIRDPVRSYFIPRVWSQPTAAFAN